MSPEVKTELNIPDAWYDFFSRFLPGTLFVFGVRIFLLDIAYYTLPSLTEGIILLGAGYIIGLTSQPISSLFIRWIQNLAARKQKREDNYVQQVIDKLGVESYSAKILLKMHGEVAYFTQLAVLSTILVLILLFNCKLKAFLVFIPPCSFLLAWMVAYRRVRRADLDDQLLQAKPASSSSTGTATTGKQTNESTGKPTNA